MKIVNITFYPHLLKRKYHWQTASYSADAVQIFYIKLEADNGLRVLAALQSCRKTMPRLGLESML